MHSPMLLPKVAVRGPGGHDELVVWQLNAIFQANALGLGINANHLTQQAGDVGLVPEQSAHRRGNGRC